MKLGLSIAALLFAASNAYAETPAVLPAVLPAVSPAAAAEKPLLQIGLPDAPSPSGFIWTGVILAFCAFGAYAVFAAKKKKSADDVMQVIARQTLGGRARLLLVSVRGRELLLSVNEKGANLLAEWPGEHLDAPEAAEQTEQSASTSAAISGLLRLREKTEPRQPIVAPKRATTVAPAAWSEVLAQEMTHARRSGR